MDCTTDTQKSRWTYQRIARLGFLIGAGWDVRRVADDPIIATTTNAGAGVLGTGTGWAEPADALFVSKLVKSMTMPVATVIRT
jgi:hypothetical protein